MIRTIIITINGLVKPEDQVVTLKIQRVAPPMAIQEIQVATQGATMEGPMLTPETIQQILGAIQIIRWKNPRGAIEGTPEATSG